MCPVDVVVTYQPGKEYHEYHSPSLIGKEVPEGPWELSVVVRCEKCEGRGREISCWYCGNTGAQEVRKNKV